MITIYLYHAPDRMCSIVMTIRTQLDPISFISKSSSNKAVPLAHELSEYELQMGAQLGIDTHADTSCAGKHMKKMDYVQGIRFSVAPFQGPHMLKGSKVVD